MKYISSDTNIWIDFLTIDRLELPFKLPYTYLMNDEVISNELLQPKGLGEKLIHLGLRATELSEEEYFLAGELNYRYRKPSLFDCIALAIAKCRQITLLTGDGALRNAAKKENVPVIGTIGILDQVFRYKSIDSEEYLFCLEELKRNNGGKVRLPLQEIQERIDKL